MSDSESYAIELAPEVEIKAPEIIDLDEWIVAVEKVNPEDQTPGGSDRPVEAAEPGAATEKAPPFTLTPEVAVSWTQFRQSEQLAFSFG